MSSRLDAATKLPGLVVMLEAAGRTIATLEDRVDALTAHLEALTVERDRLTQALAQAYAKAASDAVDDAVAEAAADDVHPPTGETVNNGHYAPHPAAAS